MSVKDLGLLIHEEKQSKQEFMCESGSKKEISPLQSTCIYFMKKHSQCFLQWRLFEQFSSGFEANFNEHSVALKH